MIEDYYVYIFSSVFAGVGFVGRYIWEFLMTRRKRELTEKINKIEFRLKEFYYPIFFYLKREQIIWEKILKLNKNQKSKSPPVKKVVKPRSGLKNIILNIHPPNNILKTENIKYLIDYIPGHKNIESKNSYDKNDKNYETNDNNCETNKKKCENYDDNKESAEYNDSNDTNDTNDSNDDNDDNDNEIKKTLKREKTINLDIIKALDEENLKIHKHVQTLIHEKICIAVPPKELVELFLQYDEHVTVYQILREINIYDKFPLQYGAPYPENLMEKIEERINELNIQYRIYSKKLG